MPTTRFALRALAAASLLATTACAIALSHPNFDAADVAMVDAVARIRAAQRVNGPTFGGHADRAIQLLQEARSELQIADEYHRGVRR